MTRMLLATRTMTSWAVGCAFAVVTAQTSGEAPFAAAAKQVSLVYRITSSVATDLEANKAISRYLWKETSDPLKADAIVVVVKSVGLPFPLNDSYKSFKELERDVDRQMNSTGRTVHLYLFVAAPDAIRAIAHLRYDQ
jgi:hypothetical protein